MVAAGFMAGVALGQKLVGMGRGQTKGLGGRKAVKSSTQDQRLQSARIAAYKRMKARQLRQIQTPLETAENRAFNAGFNYAFKDEFKDDPSGQLLNSFRKSIKEFNDWVKLKTNGILDLNMSMAIFFIIRGVRKFILEKQYPSAWQLIWWASSILRGWRFV